MVMIKHCVFCDHKHHHLNNQQKLFFVTCQGCMATGPKLSDIDAAINAWNQAAIYSKPASENQPTNNIIAQLETLLGADLIADEPEFEALSLEDLDESESLYDDDYY